MVTIAQSAANWRNTHSHGSHPFSDSLTHLHQHSYNHVMRSASSAISFQCMLGLFVYTIQYTGVVLYKFSANCSPLATVCTGLKRVLSSSWSFFFSSFFLSLSSRCCCSSCTTHTQLLHRHFINGLEPEYKNVHSTVCHFVLLPLGYDYEHEVQVCDVRTCMCVKEILNRCISMKQFCGGWQGGGAGRGL